MRLLAACLILTALVPPRAEARPRRTVAVLEHRAGVTRLANLAGRMATVLARSASLEVVTPSEARRRLDGRLDTLVARCAGDPSCIAEVGHRLHVDEVILVGISQLGDVILALQRINVARRTVLGRIAEALPPRAEPTDKALLGFLTRLLPPEDFRRYGAIQVKANVSGAAVSLDGTDRGMTPLGALTVEAPRRYDLRVSKPGYLDFTAALDVQPDGMVEVTTDLVPRPHPPAWYQRWWVWGIAGSVVAGAAATVLVLTLRPAQSPQEVPIYVDPNR